MVSGGLPARGEAGRRTCRSAVLVRVCGRHSAAKGGKRGPPRRGSAPGGPGVSGGLPGSPRPGRGEGRPALPANCA